MLIQTLRRLMALSGCSSRKSLWLTCTRRRLFGSTFKSSTAASGFFGGLAVGLTWPISVLIQDVRKPANATKTETENYQSDRQTCDVQA